MKVVRTRENYLTVQISSSNLRKNMCPDLFFQIDQGFRIILTFTIEKKNIRHLLFLEIDRYTMKHPRCQILSIHYI